MRRQLIYRSLFFWGGLALLLWLSQQLLLFGARQSVKGEAGKINRLMQHELDPELMIFGPSVALVHFDESILEKETGLSTFNFGIDGTSIEQYECFVREFAGYTQKCRYVVFAHSLFEFIHRDALYEAYKFYAHLDNGYVYRTLHDIDAALVWKMKYIPFYALSVYDPPFYNVAADGWKQALGAGQPQHLPSGYAPKDLYTFNDSSVDTIADGELQVPVDPRIFNKLQECIRLLNAKGIRVILLNMPVQQGLFKKLKDRDFFARRFGPLADGKQRFFIDYTYAPICADTGIFYNFTHMNRKGATLFSQDFARRFQVLRSQQQ